MRRQCHPLVRSIWRETNRQNQLSACGGSDPPALVSLPQLPLHGTETSWCHSALPALLSSAIKFCGGLLWSTRSLEQNAVSEIGCSVTKAWHTWHWLWDWAAERSRRGHKECWEGRQRRLKGKWEKSYWKMGDRGHLLGSGGQLDSTVTWSNIEIGNVPDKFNEIAKVILLPLIRVQNERNQLKTNTKTT